MLVEWKKERFDNIDEYITKELRQLDKMEVELWGAWERSKAVKKKVKITGDAKGFKSKAREVNEKAYMKGYEETTEEMIGNVAYLDLLLNVQQRKAKLLGYESPAKIEVHQTHEGIVGNVTYSAEDITPDMLFKMADMVQDKTFDQIQANKGKASD